MIRILIATAFFTLFVCPGNAIAEDKDAPKANPELRFLIRYIGTWDVAATSKGKPVAKGEYTAKWILDRKFVQTIGSVKTADGKTSFKVRTLMTYDATKKVYRKWSFFSSGLTSEAEAKWDPKTQTMTQTRRYANFTQSTTAKFPKKGVEEWTMITTDKAGKVLNEMRGRNTRRKD